MLGQKKKLEITLTYMKEHNYLNNKFFISLNYSMSKNIDYSEKYKQKLDKALNSYGITATDLNVNGFDASKQYTKNDYDVQSQIQGWEHDHPLRDIDTTQMTFEFNRLLNENFTDPLPARLLQQYKS